MDPLENYDNNVRNRDDSTIISKRSIANINHPDSNKENCKRRANNGHAGMVDDNDDMVFNNDDINNDDMVLIARNGDDDYIDKDDDSDIAMIVEKDDDISTNIQGQLQSEMLTSSKIVDQIINQECFKGILERFTKNWLEKKGVVEEISRNIQPIFNALNKDKQRFKIAAKDIIQQEVKNHPGIAKVFKVIDNIESKNFRIKDQNEKRYSNFKETYTVDTELYKNMTDGIYRDLKKVYVPDTHDALFCLKDPDDILAIMYLLNDSCYIQKFHRSYEYLVAQILKALLDDLKLEIEPELENDDVLLENNNEIGNTIGEGGNGGISNGNSSSGVDGNGNDDSAKSTNEDDSNLDYILGNNSLPFPDEVKTKLDELERQINKTSEDRFTDNKCPLSKRHLVKRFVESINNWKQNLSYNNLEEKAKKMLDDTKDLTSGKSGSDLWDFYLNSHTEVQNIKMDIEYHCCNMHTLFTRFYDMKKEPTCIFMIIGMSI